jgi:hypothetical protein
MPRNLARPHAAVISEAKQIYWAEVLGSKPTRLGGKARNPVRYTLKVLRTLKGQVGATAEIDGEGDLSGIWDTTFTNHTDDEFWRQSSGRMGVKGDCSMVPPHFIIGKRYLIVISPSEDTKQFERVDTQDDRWLQYAARPSKGVP